MAEVSTLPAPVPHDAAVLFVLLMGVTFPLGSGSTIIRVVFLFILQ